MMTEVAVVGGAYLVFDKHLKLKEIAHPSKVT